MVDICASSRERKDARADGRARTPWNGRARINSLDSRPGVRLVTSWQCLPRPQALLIFKCARIRDDFSSQGKWFIKHPCRDWIKNLSPAAYARAARAPHGRSKTAMSASTASPPSSPHKTFPKPIISKSTTHPRAGSRAPRSKSSPFSHITKTPSRLTSAPPQAASPKPSSKRAQAKSSPLMSATASSTPACKATPASSPKKA